MFHFWYIWLKDLMGHIPFCLRFWTAPAKIFPMHHKSSGGFFSEYSLILPITKLIECLKNDSESCECDIICFNEGCHPGNMPFLMLPSQYTIR